MEQNESSQGELESTLKDHANKLVDTIGWLAAGGILAGVLIHGAIRALRRKH